MTGHYSRSAPVFATEVKAVWTDKGITFGVKADEPAIARMHMGAPKGDPWAQDTFEIFIDPFAPAIKDTQRTITDVPHETLAENVMSFASLS